MPPQKPRRASARSGTNTSETPSTPSMMSKNASDENSWRSPEPSPTNGPPASWRPQPDSMVIPTEMIPEFVNETAQLFLVCVNQELALLNELPEMIEAKRTGKAPPREMRTSWAMLEMAASVASQIQEKYALVKLELKDQPLSRLWIPE